MLALLIIYETRAKYPKKYYRVFSFLIYTIIKNHACSRLHGIMFEDFITHSRTNRYNLLCSLVAHDKKQPSFEDEESGIVDMLIYKHVTT